MMTAGKQEQDKGLKGVFREGVRMGKWWLKRWEDEASGERWGITEKGKEECRSAGMPVEALQTSCAPSQSFLC